MKVEDIPFLKKLLAEGFNSTSDVFPEGIKPWSVFLASEKFCISITQDRGGVWLWLAPSTEISKHDFVEIRGYISYFLNDITYTTPPNTNKYNTDQKIIMLTNLLERYYFEIWDFFSKPNYPSRNKEFKKFLKSRSKYDIQKYKEKCGRKI